jgi:hypothetical protein
MHTITPQELVALAEYLDSNSGANGTKGNNLPKAIDIWLSLLEKLKNLEQKYQDIPS